REAAALLLGKEKMSIQSHTIVPRLVSEFGYLEKDAEKVVQDLQTCPLAVQEAFEKWWWGKGLDEQLAVQGYTLQRLIDEYDLEPIGAFLTIGWLIREPDVALQALSEGYDYFL